MYDDIEMHLFVKNEHRGVAPLRHEIMRERYVERLEERRTNLCHASLKTRLRDGLRTLRRLGGTAYGSAESQQNRETVARMPAE